MVDLDDNDQPVIKVKGSNDQEHHIKLPPSMREQDGKEIVIGLRPEHITESENPDSSASTMLNLQLEVLEPTGPDTIAMIKVNDQEVACRLSPEFEVKVGQVAPLHFDLSKAVFFDAQTEQRIDFN